MIVEESTGYGYDESTWPLLLIVEPRIAPSDAAFRAHLEKVRHYYERGERFGFLVDVRASAPLPASVLFRGFLKAFLWLRRDHEPTDIFSTFDDAKAWLRAKLRSSRVSPPPTAT